MKTHTFLATPKLAESENLVPFVRLEFDDDVRHSNFMSCLEIGKKIEVSYGPLLKNRSDRENRYYWGVVIDILSDYTGFSPEDMHEILKHKFLRKSVWVTNPENGTIEEIQITQSTASLTTVKFEEYLSKIREWAATLNCRIPLPNEPPEEINESHGL